MSRELTITVHDDVAHRLEEYAEAKERDVSSALTLFVNDVFGAGRGDVSQERALPDMSDEDVLSLADLQMSASEDNRLSELLQARGARPLTAGEDAERRALMGLYERLLLKKAEGLAEAVRRGLRPPLSP